MRVAFLVAGPGRSGGMGVIHGCARHLDAAVYTPEEAAESAPVDVAVATWWTTADALWDVPARRRVVLLQGHDARHYREDEPADRLGAAGVLDLPVDFVAVSPHLARVVAAAAPGAPVRVVAPGIDKAVFRAAPAREGGGPLRVLVEGQPSVWFKGVREGVAAVRAMRAPASVTVVAPEPAGTEDLGADRVCVGLAPAAMAALYAEHDVLLKLSRSEGLGLPVLEAFHTGRPCVVTHGVPQCIASIGPSATPSTRESLSSTSCSA